MKIAHALLPAVLFTGLASAQVFTVTDLGSGVLPLGINAKAQVAARNDGPPGGVLWSKETGFKELAPLPALLRSFPQALNDRGDVVGYSEDEEIDSFQATLWPHSTSSPFGLTPSVDTNTSANAINDAREIAGTLDLLLLDQGEGHQRNTHSVQLRNRDQKRLRDRRFQLPETEPLRRQHAARFYLASPFRCV